MQSRFIVLLLFTGIAFLKAYPEGVIRGRISDGATGNGLPGANVLVKQNQGTIAGQDGYYILHSKPGNITVSFQHVGYKTTTHSLQITENDTVVLNVAMEYVPTEIDQVVVSAGRIEQRISELSVSLSLIKPSALSIMHISDAKELINKTSGIEILDGQASIRGGSGFSYGAGSRVMALLDGLPVMSADAGNIRWQFLPLENISQIEIIKGASSVVYGSSALNGVINFRTADAGTTPVTRFYAESGVFGTPQNKNWKWWDSPRGFVTSSVSHLQKFGHTSLGIGANLLADNGYRRLNDQKLARFNLRVKHQNKLVEGLSYGLSLNGGTTVKTDFVLWENALTGALKQDESTAIRLHSYFYTVDPFLTYAVGKHTRHDVRTRLQMSHNKFPDSAQNNSDASNFYAEYQYWHRFSKIFSLNSGLSENYSWVNSNFYGNHNGLNAGAFAQLDINATERMRLTTGVRMEQNWLDNDHDNLIPLFRAGLNYRALDYTFLRASFGQGYRYPSIAEKYAATTLGSVKIFPSLYIKPEKGWNTEIGVKQGVLAGNLSGLVDFSLFYSQHTDMIEYIFGIYPNPGDTTYSYGFKATNMEAARVYGCELEYVLSGKTGEVTHNFTGGYVFTYPVNFNPVSGKNTEVMLKYRRKHAANLNLQSIYKNMEMNLGLYFKSKMLNIDDVFLNATTRESLLPGFYDYWTNHNKSYFLADASLCYTFKKHYRISFMVKNLTNTEYMGRPGDIQPQRNFCLRISGDF